jgi:hypothetical protein
MTLTIDQYFEDIKENFKYLPLNDVEAQFLLDAVQSFLDAEGYWPRYNVGKNFNEGKYKGDEA